MGKVTEFVTYWGPTTAEWDKTEKRFTIEREEEMLLLTVPNQLRVDYNAHVIEAILTHVAPALG